MVEESIKNRYSKGNQLVKQEMAERCPVGFKRDGDKCVPKSNATSNQLREDYRPLVDSLVEEYKTKHPMNEEKEQFVRDDIKDYDVRDYELTLHFLKNIESEIQECIDSKKERLEATKKELRNHKKRLMDKIKHNAEWQPYAKIYKMGKYSEGDK